jgi:septal ring factor EnvC (AmiA/AmiB activator)
LPRPVREAVLNSATVVTAPLRDWFNDLSATQSEVDRDMNESVAALEAYQSHLDHLQAELAAERAELDEQHASLAAERQRLAEMPAGYGNQEEQLAELGEAKKLISELRDLLLERTEELRRSESKRAELVSELQLGRSRQLELEKNHEAEKSQHLEQQLRWTEEFQRVSELLEVRSRGEGNASAGASSDPVLGSILAQFGKLRRQAADRRAERGGK